MKKVILLLMCFTQFAFADVDGVITVGSNQVVFKGQTSVSAGGRHICISARETGIVKCWGSNGVGQLNVPTLNTPYRVSAGAYHTCAMDKEGVKCWGDNRYGQLNIPALYKPFYVIAERNHTCAYDSEGIKCWGDIPFEDINNLNLKSDLVLEATHSAPAVRAEYLKPFSKLIEESDFNSPTIYLQYLLVSPAVLNTDSQYFTDLLIPEFHKGIETLQNTFGYSDLNDGLSKIPDNEKNRKIAITSIQSALFVVQNFLGFDSQAGLQDGIRTAGSAVSDPMNNQKILDLVKQVDAFVVEKQKLKSSPKSAFLVDTLELAASWLREKVK